MKPPRRRLTVRALAAIVAFFAVDFGGITWVQHRRDVTLAWVLGPAVFLAPFAIGFWLIYWYVPPRLDEAFTVILILVLLLALLIPALQHS
jgi:uncharacterized membrane protein YfcA